MVVVWCFVGLFLLLFYGPFGKREMLVFRGSLMSGGCDAYGVCSHCNVGLY